MWALNPAPGMKFCPDYVTLWQKSINFMVLVVSLSLMALDLDRAKLVAYI